MRPTAVHPTAVHRALDAELAAARERRGGSDPRVLDVGGGTGGWAVPLARAGGRVTVIDPSPNALAALQRRAHDDGVADRITAVQGDTEALVDVAPAGAADLVLGHGVLEVVDDPAAAARVLRSATCPGGAVSVLTANRYAAVLHRALSGHLDEARQLLDDPAGRVTGPGEVLLRRFDSDSLQRVLLDAGLRVELLQGDGVLAELVPGSVLDVSPKAAETLAELELAACGVPALRGIASRLHVLARRPEQPTASPGGRDDS